MTQNHNSTAFATPRKKRIAVGAVSVLTAGALLGLGAQGAVATPLTPTAATTSSAESTAGTETTAEAATEGAVVASLKKELRAALAQGQDFGEKAQNVAGTLAGHTEIFESLPENLQTDLTALTDATDEERTAVAETIAATALDGGYGEQVQKVATAIEENPTHPLHAAAHALKGELEKGHDAASLTQKALTLVDNPALFEKLPADLQADLTALKDAPADERDAAAQEIKTAALAGEYGAEVQAFAERILSGGGAHAAAEADATADTDAGN